MNKEGYSMANLDVLWFPGMGLILFAMKYWLLILIILVSVITGIILWKKKKKNDKEDNK
jgi:cytochrome b subunit of formate dehydrogenase